MAPGKSRRARRPRDEAARGPRAEDAGTAQGVGRAARILDERAARLAAGDLLSRRAWTRAGLVARLRRRGAPADLAAAVVAELVRRGYVDDAAFARGWVAARVGRGYGARRLRAELRARGVEAAHVEAALDGIEGEQAVERARVAARGRLPALRRGAPERVAARLHAFLCRRGYAGAVALRVVRELTGASAAPE